jgi:N-acetylmuramoyl-L-alanine amidase
MKLDWLADAAAETGYPVIEVDGWENRGKSTGYNPSTVVAHHTAGPSGGGDMPSLGIIVNGRKDLAGPLANYALGRSGTIYVVASGKSNNAGAGGWKGCGSNYCTVGIEPENDGKQPWPQVQLDSYGRLAAAILNRLEKNADRLCSHKEWATGRKVDPHSINMSKARVTIQNLLDQDQGGGAMPWTKLGDPVDNLADARAVNEFQGWSFWRQSDFDYDENDPKSLDERAKVITSRLVQELMLQGERIKKLGG